MNALLRTLLLFAFSTCAYAQLSGPDPANPEENRTIIIGPSDLNPPPPASLDGDYRGFVTVVEALPLNGSPTVSTPKTTIRVKATYRDGALRVQAAPGSTLLSYLDQPAYASIRIGGRQPSAFYPAESRAGNGVFAFNGRKLTVTFQFTRAIPDFAAGGTPISSQVAITIELVRVAN